MFSCGVVASQIAEYEKVLQISEFHIIVFLKFSLFQAKV